MFYRMLGPSFLSALALAVADIADALVVGNRVGETCLAAIGIVTPLYMVYNLIGYTFSIGGSVMHGRLSTSGDTQMVSANFRRLLVILMGIAAAIAVFGNLTLRPMLALLGVGADRAALLSMCEAYARPMLYAAPIFLLNFLLYDFIRCDDDAGFASVGFSLGCVSDLCLNILFVIILDWGVRGAIASTVIAQSVSVAVQLCHFFNHKGLLTWQSVLKAKAENVGSVCRQSLGIGFSASVQYIFQFLFLMLGNRLLLLAGDRGLINGDLYVAVFDVVMNVSYVALALYQASADTLQPLASIFSSEHDEESLRYVLHLTMLWGLSAGIVLSLLLGIFAAPVAALFGLTDAAVEAVHAIRIFCLSTPFAGILIIQIRYDQCCGRKRLSGLATLLRTQVLLLPATVLLGLFMPSAFWWLFPVTEGTACLLMQIIRPHLIRQKRTDLPVFSAGMDAENRDLGRVMEALTAYCEENEIEMRQAVLIQLAVEELSLVTIEQAFKGQPDEYIQLTLVSENQNFILHIRNSAPYFNPLDMRIEKMRQEAEDSVMDSVGVMMVKEKVKGIQYWNYEGCNVLTVVF